MGRKATKQKDGNGATAKTKKKTKMSVREMRAGDGATPAKPKKKTIIARMPSNPMRSSSKKASKKSMPPPGKKRVPGLNGTGAGAGGDGGGQAGELDGMDTMRTFVCYVDEDEVLDGSETMRTFITVEGPDGGDPDLPPDYLIGNSLMGDLDGDEADAPDGARFGYTALRADAVAGRHDWEGGARSSDGDDDDTSVQLSSSGEDGEGFEAERRAGAGGLSGPAVPILPDPVADFMMIGYDDPPPNPASQPFKPTLKSTMSQAFLDKREVKKPGDWKQHTHLYVAPTKSAERGKAASCPPTLMEDMFAYSPRTEQELWQESQYDIEAEIQDEAGNITERSGNTPKQSRQDLHTSSQQSATRPHPHPPSGTSSSSSPLRRTSSASSWLGSSRALSSDLAPTPEYGTPEYSEYDRPAAGGGVADEAVSDALAKSGSMRVLEEARAKKQRLLEIRARRQEFKEAEQRRMVSSRSDTAMLAIEQAKLENMTSGYLTRTSSLLRNPFDPDSLIADDSDPGTDDEGVVSKTAYSQKAMLLRPDWSSIAPALPMPTMQRRGSVGELGGRPRRKSISEEEGFAAAPRLT